MKFIDVEEQYKEYSDVVRSDVLNILNWMKQQPHLPNITELEAFYFLHSCHGSVENAKNVIDIFYTIRTHTPEFFGNRDILADDMTLCRNVIKIAPLRKQTSEGFKVSVSRIVDKDSNNFVFADFLKINIAPLRTLSPEGYKISITKMVDNDPNKFIFSDSLKLISYYYDVWMLEEGTALGHVITIDVEGITFGHLTRIGLMTLKKFLYYLQEGAPIRLKAIHFININSFMDKIMAMMKPFLKKDLMESIHLHNDLESFYKFVPKNILPKEYGGLEESLEILHENYFKHLVEQRDYFLDEEKTRRVNENLRPGRPKNVSDIFGTEGNFKQLQVD